MKMIKQVKNSVQNGFLSKIKTRKQHTNLFNRLIEFNKNIEIGI